MCIYIVRYATLKLPPALPSPLFAMRDIRMTVTAKTAPEPRVMAKFFVAMKEYAAIAPNLMLPQAKLRQAVWYENDEVEILIIIIIVSTIIFYMRIFLGSIASLAQVGINKTDIGTEYFCNDVAWYLRTALTALNVPPSPRPARAPVPLEDPCHQVQGCQERPGEV